MNNNNLRISHESLNMDEIISELNPGSQAPSVTGNGDQMESQSQLADDSEIPSFRTQQQKMASTKPQTNTKALKSPKRAQATPTQNGKKPNVQNVKSSGYGQPKANAQAKNGSFVADQEQASNPQTNASKNQKSAMLSYNAARQNHFGQRRDSGAEVRRDQGQANGHKQQLQLNVEGTQVGGHKAVNGVTAGSSDSYNATASTQLATNLTHDASSKNSLVNNLNSSSSVASGAKNIYPAGRQVFSSRYDVVAEDVSLSQEPDSVQSQRTSALESQRLPQFQQFRANDDMEETLDNENFAQRLDQLILNFRTETMQEFIKTKGRLNNQKEQNIDAERRRCNTLLSAKQGEIEQLKEQLAKQTKMAEEYSLRSEIMALWSGKGQTLARMKVVQMKCFRALQEYREFKKHTKIVLEHRNRTAKAKRMREVFQAWHKNFKVAKVRRDKEKFDDAVKVELQSISATYQKEIETLRSQLNDAQRQQAITNRNKQFMQDNLKKVFMRSVCALNFEAMSILDPADQQNAQVQMQKEMEKQMQSAMNIDGIDSIPNGMTQNYPGTTRSEISFNLSEAGQNDQTNLGEEPPNPQGTAERELLSMALNAEMDKQMNHPRVDQPVPLDANQRKIESKDSRWKPAPIIGREMTLNQQPQMAVHNPSMPQTSMIQQNLERQQQMQHMQQMQPLQQPGMPQQTETPSFEQRLQQLRQESSQIEVQMRTNNAQNNYQLPAPIQHQQFDSIRQDPKFDELMAQIKQNNEQREVESQHQMHGQGMNPQVMSHAPPAFANAANPFLEQHPVVESSPAQHQPTQAPVFSSFSHQGLPSNLPSGLASNLPSNLPSNLSGLPQVNSAAHQQNTGKAIYAHGAAPNDAGITGSAMNGGQQFGAVKINTTHSGAMRMTAARKPGQK